MYFTSSVPSDCACFPLLHESLVCLSAPAWLLIAPAACGVPACSAAMEAVGLRALGGSAVLPAFAAAGVLPRQVHARLSLARFCQVNTVKGPWSFVDDLTATSALPAPSAPAQQQAPAAEAQGGAGTAPAGAEPAPALQLEDVRAVVRRTVEEVLGEGGGELEGDGQFPAGEGARPGQGGLVCLRDAACLFCCFDHPCHAHFSSFGLPWLRTLLTECEGLLLLHPLVCVSPQAGLTASRRWSSPAGSAALWGWPSHPPSSSTTHQSQPWWSSCSPSWHPGRRLWQLLGPLPPAPCQPAPTSRLPACSRWCRA